MNDPRRTRWRAEIDPARAGVRLDQFVAEHADCSRSRARELLAEGAIDVDGRVAREKDKGLRLGPGQVVRARVAIEELEAIVVDPTSALVVLAEGEGWVAIDKPAGVAVHPLRASHRGTLLQRVAARWPQIEGVGEGGRRSGVLHRLDVDTSGVQLFAYEEAAWQRLRRAFREHHMQKVYRALVHGVPPARGELELDLVIAAHRPARVRVMEGAPGARRCGLRWCVLESWPDASLPASLVEVRPRTGFLHQVRASLAHLGHPLFGDATYGADAPDTGAPRHLLHASALRFEEIDVHSADPPDLTTALARLRGR